ncbi:MAG: glycosyltransferase [Bacteroidales bacterium]|jgi:glycosyltransferase involved in cell wall biosynthesis
MPDLAVIMSVYKNDKLLYVTESVQSILNQTFTKFDYYIVFDGPVKPDIDNYITSLIDKRIRLFRLKKNKGLAKALNFLLEIVMKNPEHRLIARMDADDISLPERFEKQNNFLNANPDISCVGCWSQEIDESGKHLSDRKLPIDHEALRKRYYTRTPFAHPSVMYRREFIEKTGFYPTDTILMEDNALWGNALKAGLRLANIPEYLFKFRKDNMFYKRRSGLKYGWNFIKTRFKINNSLKAPVYSYVFILLIGLIKILPPFFLRYFYSIKKK